MPVETAKNCNRSSVVATQRFSLSCLFSIFFFVLFNYLVFCVLIMLNVSCEGNLSQPSRVSQAADNLLSDSESEELSDKIYESISSNILKCNYFDLKEITQIYSSENNSLNIIHFNIRSLNKNFDKFYDFIQSLSYTPDVVCLSESRIKKQPLINVNLPGYTFLNFSSLKNAGGVAMHVKNDLKFKNEQAFDPYGCESL